jgi:hypothetical protein
LNDVKCQHNAWSHQSSWGMSHWWFQ